MKTIYNFSVYLYALSCTMKRAFKSGLHGEDLWRGESSRYIAVTIMENLKDDVFEY